MSGRTRLFFSDKATLGSIRLAIQRSILVPTILLPAADLLQHAEDIVGVAAPDRRGIFAETLRPDLYSADDGALDSSHFVAADELTPMQKTPALCQLHPVPILRQQLIQVFRDDALAGVALQRLRLLLLGEPLFIGGKVQRLAAPVQQIRFRP